MHRGRRAGPCGQRCSSVAHCLTQQLPFRFAPSRRAHVCTRDALAQSARCGFYRSARDSALLVLHRVWHIERARAPRLSLEAQSSFSYAGALISLLPGKAQSSFSYKCTCRCCPELLLFAYALVPRLPRRHRAPSRADALSLCCLEGTELYLDDISVALALFSSSFLLCLEGTVLSCTGALTLSPRRHRAPFSCVSPLPKAQSSFPCPGALLSVA